MKKIVQAIPNTLTICNLLCGCMAIVFAFDEKPEYVFWAIIAAAAFDFLDGFMARMLKAYSPLGADLDSLSDVVSFGVAPSIAIFVMLRPEGWIAYSAFLLAAFGALRLAKFNIDTRQTTEFRGLPIPAMALFFVSMQFILPDMELWNTVGFVILISALMVSDIPMFALKFKNFGVKDNIVRYVFLALCVLLIAMFGVFLAPMLIISVYILFSMTLYILGKRGRKV